MYTWIFQANPDRFDIDGFLETRPIETTWLVTRYKSQIKVGDDVFLWRAIGSGEDTKAGIILKAEVISDVGPRADDPGSAPFWETKTDGDDVRDRVWLRILRVANKKEILQRKWFAEDPILSDLEILKMANATNYSISAHHTARINALWEKTGNDFTYAESVAGLWAYSRTYGKSVSKLMGSPVADVALKAGRAVGGVYNKVMNFRSLDPRDKRAGLDGASDVDKAVWTAFFDPGPNVLHTDKIESEMARLWPGNGVDSPADEAEAIESNVEKEARKLLTLSLDELEKLYARDKVKQKGKPRVRRSSTRAYDRSPIIIAMAKVRARFACEVPGCSYALFLDEEGHNFCEVHHVHPLSEGGLDTPGNVACICPSHHREAHHGKESAKLRLQLTAVREPPSASGRE